MENHYDLVYCYKSLHLKDNSAFDLKKKVKKLMTSTNKNGFLYIFYHLAKNLFDYHTYSKNEYFRKGEIIKIFDSTWDIIYINENNIETDDHPHPFNNKKHKHLVGFEEQIGQLMKRLYSPNNTKLVSDERRENIKNLVSNANFMKKEYGINIKTIYEVDFDTNELIDKSVQAINGKLYIVKMQVKITEGEQKDKMSSVSVNSGSSMTEGKTKTETVEDFSPSMIEYDLIG